MKNLQNTPRPSLSFIGAAMIALAVAAFSPSVARAADLPAPTGPVILTVEGAIGATNRDGAADFDRAMLRDLGWHEIESVTDWTEGPQRFAGVPLTALLEAVEARGDSLRVVALNDYAADVPAADAADHDVLLALQRNGEPMSVRDKGPIWIIYPQESVNTEGPGRHNDKMVWQLRTIVVR